MPSATVEDYLKQIYLESSDELLPMGHLAHALKVTPGTATAMVKRLAAAELVAYEPYSGVKLTQAGQQTALDVLRRHRLIESFLVEILKLDWAEVHEEAERLEHAVSPRLLTAIDALLGHPTVDPHGDPIPGDGGEISRQSHQRLADCIVGDQYRIARIADQRPEFLQFLANHKLRPGNLVTILDSDSTSEAMTLKTDADGDEAKVTLALTVASRVLVCDP
ncbi:MAG: metal-dependent transcriptional regulator [Phycisphaerales bacterium]|nr:metal-dependent transcriptional regulator [Phycisphaerales bacterium]